MASKKWIDPFKAAAILDLNAANVPPKEIADEVGVSKSSVYREISRYAAQSWTLSRQAREPVALILAVQKDLFRISDLVAGLAVQPADPGVRRSKRRKKGLANVD